MSPCQPSLSDLLTTDNSKAKKIVQTATVNANRNNLGSIKDRVEGKSLLDSSFPVRSPGPAIGAQPHADFDIQVLRGPAAKLFLAGIFRGLEFFLQAINRDAAVAVR